MGRGATKEQIPAGAVVLMLLNERPGNKGMEDNRAVPSFLEAMRKGRPFLS